MRSSDSFFIRRKFRSILPDTLKRVWGPVHPAGMIIDVADIQYVVRTLAQPSTDGKAGKLSNRRTGLNRPRMVFEVQKKDGSHVAMFVGRHFRSRDGGVYFYVKQQDSAVVYVISETTLTRLRRGFGQG